MSFESSSYRQQQEEQPLPRIFDVTEGLKSKQTKITYRIAFNHFLKVTIKSQNLRALLDTKHNVIESKIIDHITYLKEVEKLTYRSILVYLSGIFHFFEMNDVNLNTRKIKRFLPENESEHYARDRPYFNKEIEQVLSKCDIRSRVAVLIMVSTGMRIGGLRELRIGDIKKIDEFNLYLIWVYNRSVKDRYYTFCTPECAAAIDAYLDYRRRLGDQLKESAPLIRDKFNIDDPFTAQSPKFLSIRMLSFIFEDILKRAGVNQPAITKPKLNKRDVMRSHGFRKFFITQCDKANVSFTVREYLSGHKLPNQDASYIRTSEEDRIAEYVKVVPLLTIDQSQRLQNQVEKLESERITKEDLEELRRQWFVELSKERALISLTEWNELKAQIEKLKDAL